MRGDRTHVTISVSFCGVLSAGDPVSGANDAGRRDGISHVVHERRCLVEWQRGAEISSGVLRRHVANSAWFDGQHSVERIERHGAGGLAGEI